MLIAHLIVNLYKKQDPQYILDQARELNTRGAYGDGSAYSIPPHTVQMLINALSNVLGLFCHCDLGSAQIRE